LKRKAGKEGPPQLPEVTRLQSGPDQRGGEKKGKRVGKANGPSKKKRPSRPMPRRSQMFLTSAKWGSCTSEEEREETKTKEGIRKGREKKESTTIKVGGAW